MSRTSSLAIAAALALPLLAPNAAHAVTPGPGGTQPRAWVSQLGNDVMGCGIGTNPCRTFQYAHDNIVVPGGSIYIHDVGNYGQIVIGHAISIINDGVGDATIFAASGDAIAIAAQSTDAIFIKGLTLDGAGTGSNGINLTSAGSLTVANCTIKGFAPTNYLSTGNGIYIAPTSGAVSFNIFDTIVTGNANVGVYVIPSGSGSASGIVKNVTGNNNNTYGLAVQAASASATVVDSVFLQNHYGALYVGPGSLSVSNSAATGNGASDLYNGGFGGTLTSYQNNIYNTAIGPITPASLH